MANSWHSRDVAAPACLAGVDTLFRDFNMHVPLRPALVVTFLCFAVPLAATPPAQAPPPDASPQGTGGGAWLLTPDEELEAALEVILARGIQALQQGDRRACRRAEKALVSLRSLSPALVMARFAPPPIGLMGKGVQSRHPEGSMVEMVPGPAHPDHPNPGGPEFPHGRLSPGARRRVDQALEEWRGLRQRQGDPQPEASCAVM